MLLDAARAQLVLVDYQLRLMPALHEGEQTLGHAVTLGRLAQMFQVPVWGTEHVPDKLGGNVPALRALCHQTIAKQRFSAVHDGLLALLRPSPEAGCAPEQPREQVVVAGCEAHVCLLQTAMELLQEGFSVFVVVDACSSRTPRNRDVAFERLKSAGAHLVSTEMVAFEWCRSAQHPDFRRMLAQVK